MLAIDRKAVKISKKKSGPLLGAHRTSRLFHRKRYSAPR